MAYSTSYFVRDVLDILSEAETNTTTTVDFRDSPDYRGHRIRILNSTLIAITTLIVGSRFYVRFFMSKTPGIDDFICFLAYACIVTQSALDIRCNKPSTGQIIHKTNTPSYQFWDWSPYCIRTRGLDRRFLRSKKPWIFNSAR